MDSENEYEEWIKFADSAIKALKKIDRHQALMIFAWIEKNLEGCANPRLYGKALTTDFKGFWRYRIGSYRVIAEIKDAVVTIEIVDAGRRRDIYKR